MGSIHGIITANLQVVGKLKSELVVSTTELGAHHSCSGETAVDYVSADNNPAFDRGNEQTLEKFRANGSLQNPRRNNIDVLELAVLDGRPCRNAAAKKTDKNRYCKERLHVPSVTGENEQEKTKSKRN
jgi:hypothetical protein